MEDRRYPPSPVISEAANTMFQHGHHCCVCGREIQWNEKVLVSMTGWAFVEGMDAPVQVVELTCEMDVEWVVENTGGKMEDVPELTGDDASAAWDESEVN